MRRFQRQASPFPGRKAAPSAPWWWLRHSCEETLRLDQGPRKLVDFLARVVHRKGSPTSRRYAEPRQQRHYAMRSGPYRDAGPVDDRSDVVRMRALYFKGDDRPFVRRGADDAKRVDL